MAGRRFRREDQGGNKFFGEPHLTGAQWECLKDMKYVVQNLLNFNPPYSGNLMKSLLALEKAMFDSEMAMVYLLPKEAMERDWVRDLISEGKRVYFRNSTVFEALNSINNDYPVSIIHSHFSYIDDYKGIIRFKRDHPGIKTVFHSSNLFLCVL